ncbi:hypothetical protein Mgra_00006317 [Meloidogyne graminicola]|uniref:Uncharacterized protein n=1 Tax=Meloidogyne graminicola TaxID=189291 RepID=A0A8S9ZLK4_9BILA|nr:hypothetical protein Mgra_00006317 [Meloidogyne graminicola]
MAATTANNTITLSNNSPHSSSSSSSLSRPLIGNSSSSSRRGISSPPSLLNSRLFARFSTSSIYSQQQNQEQKIAELRAAYSSVQTTTSFANSSLNAVRNNKNCGRPSRASLPISALNVFSDVVELAQNGNSNVVENATPTKTGLLLLQHSKGTALSTTSLLPTTTTGSRRGSAVANCLPTPSIMEIAAAAGLLSLSPSDLVFESSVLGIAYYDFILSVSEVENSSKSNSTKTLKEENINLSILTKNSSISSDSSSNTLLNRPSSNPKAKICKHGSEPSPSRTKNDFDKLNNIIPSSSLFSSKNSGKHRRLDAERKTSSQSARQEKPEVLPRKCSSPPPTIINNTDEHQLLQRNNTTYSNCNYRLFLAKLDTHTNVEWFESVVVAGDLLERNLIPVNELSLLTMGILVWRSRLANSRLLCLANGQLGEDSTTALEALKRAAAKYRCNHHVLTIGQRRQSASSTHSSCSTSSFRSSSSSGSHGQSSQQDAGMKLRVLMCQSRSELPELPSQALRDAKFLLAPSSNPLLCLCFPLT